MVLDAVDLALEGGTGKEGGELGLDRLALLLIAQAVENEPRIATAQGVANLSA
jgi:hypothetical protein